MKSYAISEVRNVEKKMPRVFRLLQWVAAGVGLVGTYVAYYLISEGVAACQGRWEEWLALGEDYRFTAVWGIATVAVVGLVSYVALWQFVTMCQRLKQGTAFTAANEQTMGRIALCCAVASGTLLLALLVLLCFCPALPLGLVLLTLLACAAYGAVALVAYALRLLVRRAAALQQESELTV